jgi:zinc D-Ala-D-Ala dipeptidase
MRRTFFALLLVVFSASARAEDLPPDFVRLRDVDPSIIQDIRYAGWFNFNGAPVPGYAAPECILRKEAAHALAGAQKAIQRLGYTLKVLDCYRPHRATRAFMAWAKAPGGERLKQQFFPDVPKSELIKRGFIASRSNHSLGIAVDLVVVKPSDVVATGEGAGACDGPLEVRAKETSLDFGTAFDCFSLKSATHGAGISAEAQKNRAMLVAAMQQNGFSNYAKEWWHFTWGQRPKAVTIMDFEITDRSREKERDPRR